MYVNGGSVIAIGVIFPVLGLLAVTGRFFVRLRHQKGRLWVDDWLCLPALAFLIATGALMIYGSAAGTIGYHSPPNQDLAQALAENTPQTTLTLKLEWVIDLLNPIGTGLIRLSFLFFYRRLFRGRAFDITSWTMIGVVVAWMVAFTVSYFCVCGSDLAAVWGSIGAIQTKCFKTLDFLGLQGITSFILDVIILSIPFFWIWNLRMSTAQKWAVSSVFLCGLFTLAASCLRMVAAIQTLNYVWGQPEDVVGLKGVNDTIGAISVWLFWQYVENGTGMVVCCLPSLKPLVTSKSVSMAVYNVRSWTSNRFNGNSGRRIGSSHGSSNEADVEKSARCITVTRNVDLHTVPVSTSSSSTGESQGKIG